jgi:hypothetical protein
MSQPESITTLTSLEPHPPAMLPQPFTDLTNVPSFANFPTPQIAAFPYFQTPQTPFAAPNMSAPFGHYPGMGYPWMYGVAPGMTAPASIAGIPQTPCNEFTIPSSRNSDNISHEIDMSGIDPITDQENCEPITSTQRKGQHAFPAPPDVPPIAMTTNPGSENDASKRKRPHQLPIDAIEMVCIKIRQLCINSIEIFRDMFYKFEFT